MYLHQRQAQQPRGQHQDEGSSYRLHRSRLPEGKVLCSVPLPLGPPQDGAWRGALKRHHQQPPRRPASHHQQRGVSRQYWSVGGHEAGGRLRDCSGRRGQDRLHTGKLLVKPSTHKRRTNQYTLCPLEI